MGSDVKVREWLDGDVCLGQDTARLEEEEEVAVVSSLGGPWMVDVWEPGAEHPFLGDACSVWLWYFEKCFGSYMQNLVSPNRYVYLQWGHVQTA